MKTLLLPCMHHHQHHRRSFWARYPRVQHKMWIAMVCFLLPMSAQAEATLADKQNPLQGTWEWVNIKNGCTEVYIFDGTGKAHITSGTEISKAEYTISPSPSSAGYYQVKLKIVQDMGGKDCSDEELDNTGEEYTKYLMFHPAGSQYVSCDQERVDTCVGPLKRLD